MSILLKNFYGRLPWPPADLFQFLVWEILSRDSLPARRDLAWLALKKIPALTPDAMFRASAIELLDAVGLAGPHREDRIERLRVTVDEFKRYRDDLDDDCLRRSGVLRASRALSKLSQFDAAAKARAHLFAAAHLVLPVDGEISRVVNRLMGTVEPAGLTRGAQARDANRLRRRARRWLMERLPREVDAYRDAVVYLRHHAHHTCLPVGPHCGVCPLAVDCPSRSSRNDRATL